MPQYRIHHLKEPQRQQFRWAPHTPGVSVVKTKDYEPGAIMESASPYTLWLALRESGDAMAVGDIIELPGGELRILKYIGFEEACWYVPESTPRSTVEAVEVT